MVNWISYKAPQEDVVDCESEEATYPNKNAHTYKKYHFKCKKCSWEGLGSQSIDLTDVIGALGVNCPDCHALIEFIYFPSTQEILKYGTTQDKEEAEKWIKEKAELKAKWAAQEKQYPDLSSPEQLPDIASDEIIITLREEGERSDIYKHEFIVLYFGEQEIWRVHNGFEYYTCYLRWGEILKEKYGERLVDFEVAEYTVDLGGDSGSAFDKVDRFRKTLKRFRDKMGWMIWITKTQPREYGMVRWETPSRELKWLDELVAQGKATLVDGSEGEHRAKYHIKASDILPLVSADESLEANCGPIGYGDGPILQSMNNSVFRYKETIAGCEPDEILCIQRLDMLRL